MHFRFLAFAPSIVLLIAACSGPASTAAPTASVASPAPVATGAALKIEVKMTDALKMEPAEITVKAGQSVTFVVTNVGAIEHEFYLGDEAMQAAEEQRMKSGAMVMDSPEGITVKPGETRELTYTFDTVGQTIAGCHVVGHYAAGMKATITVGA